MDQNNEMMMGGHYRYADDSRASQGPENVDEILGLEQIEFI